ncbi:MAG: endonuclease domain-containing protein [Bifidobacteriaceae bacterium]|nr:endonuclease domain-containing protein [Bifidobacteriaceae bacterium]
MFTRKQAMAGGLTRAQTAYRVATGVWRRVAGKAYALAAEKPWPHDRLHAMAATWPDATVYGITAMAYWEPNAPLPTGSPVHCAIPHARRPQVGLVPHRTTVPEESTAHIEGIRVQRRIPALVAALAAMPAREAQSLLAWMIARRKVTHADFARAIIAYAPRRHVRRLRSYLPLVAAGTASHAEFLARGIFIQHGITGWATNALVRTRRGDPKSADFLFAIQRLIVMIDGWAYHGNRRAFQLDRQDQNDLVANGYSVLRFTYPDLKERPADVADQVRTMIARFTPDPRRRAQSRQAHAPP